MSEQKDKKMNVYHPDKDATSEEKETAAQAIDYYIKDYEK